ncbi:MAG: hypothetical protein K8F25_14595, partial [Fimbriimonadaceae bacterium]|nr:hypothetical protein [Alphaproteobacteria bacterium]
IYNPGIDGAALARKSMELPRVKRFYKVVAIGEHENGFQVLLDNRQIKTPGKAQPVVPQKALAELMLAEWNAQQDFIESHKMPVTRLINTAIDNVAQNRRAVIADTAGYAGSDLVCYRVQSPRELIDLQAEHWDPVLDWCRDELDAPFNVASGVIPVDQPPSSLKKIRYRLEKTDDFTLSAIASMTNLLGSVLLALAVVGGKMDADTAWRAAHVDEDWQIENWGVDEEAQERREIRWLEMQAAARVAAISQIV